MIESKTPLEMCQELQDKLRAKGKACSDKAREEFENQEWGESRCDSSKAGAYYDAAYQVAILITEIRLQDLIVPRPAL